MKKFQPDQLLRIVSLLADITTSQQWLEAFNKQIHEALSPNSPPPELDPEHTKLLYRQIGATTKLFAQLGFTASLATAQKVARLSAETAPSRTRLAELSEELAGRLLDELAAASFMSLTPAETRYYNNPREGWERITERFPESISDVEEAAKCFALSRYAASVFHSLQVVELGLIELGKFLSVADPLSGWTAVSKRLTHVVAAKYQDRTEFERANFPLIEQLQGTVEALKNAWRNKISHAHGKLAVLTADFSAEIAEEILYASRAFMHRLVDGLPPLELIPLPPDVLKGLPG